MNWQKIGSLLRDLVILVLGILISLMLNDWREDRIARSDELRVIQQMADDLVSDTAMLGQNLNNVERLLELAEFARSENARLPDSLVRAGASIWSLSTYVPVRPQQTALHELTYQDQHRNIRHPKLISRFVNLHEGVYNLMDRVTNQHASYLLEDMVPYLNANMPPIRQIMGGAENTVPTIERLLNTMEMQNRVEWMRILLMNVDAVMMAAKKESEEILTEINEKYEAL